MKITVYILRLTVVFAVFLMGQSVARAQEPVLLEDDVPQDTIAKITDSEKTAVNVANSANATGNDSVIVVKVPRDWAVWTPKPQKALWMALVIPGGGQIYNRKYWKLPLIYGGFMGCLYAMAWNNTMYKDYSQAYLDIMDSDPNTQSYNKFLHLGNTINDSNIERYKTIFKKRKDKYRRWRDMSFFCLIGVYALSVVDAYVDAELSEFDISKDLSMKVRPTIMPNQNALGSFNPLENSSVGLQCSLNF